MKHLFYILAFAAIISSCSTSKKATTSKVAPVPPEGITFTEIVNYKQFASIQMPYAGKGFSKQNTGRFNDSGEEVYTALFYGIHIKTWDDLSNMSYLKEDDLKDDVNLVFEAMKKKGAFGLKSYLKQENVVENYSDVKLGGRTCKRYLLSYNYTKGDYSVDKFVLGYIIPHNKTTAWIALESSKIKPDLLEQQVTAIDEVFKYMIETVEFREQ